MSKFSALVGFAALAGIGFYVGKKLIEKRNAEEEERAQHVYEDDSEVFVEERHSTPKEKLQRASLFAVGAIKTGTEKFKEGIDDIINNDMVAKGETTVAETKDKAVAFAKDAKEKTVDFAKNTTENIKDGIENIKSKVTQKTDEAAEGAEDLADAIEKDVEDLTNKAVDMAEAVKDPAPVVENAADTAKKAADIADDAIDAASNDMDSLSMDSISSDSVETFDFSNPEEL